MCLNIPLRFKKNNKFHRQLSTVVKKRIKFNSSNFIFLQLQNIVVKCINFIFIYTVRQSNETYFKTI